MLKVDQGVCVLMFVHKYGVSRNIVMGKSSWNSMWWRDIHKLLNGGVFASTN